MLDDAAVNGPRYYMSLDTMQHSYWNGLPQVSDVAVWPQCVNVAWLQVAWTAGEADEVVLTRLKNASVIHGFHEEKVFVRMAITRADTPGGAVSAANFDGREEEVQVNLAVELLPPKVKLQPMHPVP